MKDQELRNQSPFAFHRQMLDCVVGGVSALDIQRLSIHSREQGKEFARAYGYDIDDPEHLEQLRATHRRAVGLIQEQLLEAGESIPASLIDPAQLKDPTNLLIAASSREPETREEQRWACAILRVMHVYVHLRNDLFSAFRDEIQGQILKPLQDVILHDDMAGQTILGPSMFHGDIRLNKFEVKPFKTTSSSVIKLLARPERVALTLLDKLGVRFVTRNVFDAFQVIRFLVDNHIVSYPHIIPDQSNNTLYPVNLFIEILGEVKQRVEGGEVVANDEVETLLKQRLEKERERAEFLAKKNQFSGPEYRFIKFINRKLITVPIGAGGAQRAFRFFYPYEIQVMDYETYVGNLSGPMAHDEYKNRQRKKARDRVLRSSGDDE
jgi:uncharacterized protein (TIGR04562 family)